MGTADAADFFFGIVEYNVSRILIPVSHRMLMHCLDHELVQCMSLEILYSWNHNMNTFYL